MCNFLGTYLVHVCAEKEVVITYGEICGPQGSHGNEGPLKAPSETGYKFGHFFYVKKGYFFRFQSA